MIIEYDNQVTDTRSGINGDFNFENITASEVILTFEKEGYNSTRFQAILKKNENLDLGQMRLRQSQLDNVLPDLVINNLKRLSMQTDPQTLAVSGKVQVNIKNQGTADAGLFKIRAFRDVNSNGIYDDQTDIAIGQAKTAEPLTVDQMVALELNLTGKLPYRDAPITLQIDSAQEIIESNEANNLNTTASQCVFIPGIAVASGIEYKQKWYWQGTQEKPNDRSVFGPVSVGQLSDDNQDDAINHLDTPDIIFAPYNGYLTAISGSDSSTLWQNTTSSVTGLGSTAIGDIDHDGLVEILIVDSSRNKILAFEHDGSLKWSTPVTPSKSRPRDAISLADLNHDGQVEIILGRLVFDATGQLLWEGSKGWGGSTSYGIISTAADINLDGTMEVIAGRSVYDHQGSLVWHQANFPTSTAFNGIGNFDDDDFAEIVLVGSGKVAVLEHTGEFKWGPVSLPGGGHGGPPTIADFDGDGKVEIGIAGSSQYVVFETDGSIKWTSPTEDYSSNRTGSSLFDFDDDGKSEVVYADEKNLYVYDGATGDILLKLLNSSATTLEYPVIADIDNDGHAEIIVGSNNGDTAGLKALEAINDDWAPTRAIWNQHAYHITNINDDGSIPQYEKHSWLTHNTYRLNTFIDHDAKELPDITVSQLKLIDQGASLSLTVLVGNAGVIAIPANTNVVFYLDDPNTGTELGRITLNQPLNSNESVVLTLDNLQNIPEGSQIHALADVGNSLFECSENNNSDQTIARGIKGSITLSLATTEITDLQTLNITTNTTNTGFYTSSYIISILVEDIDYHPVESLVDIPLNSLASTEQKQSETQWLNQDNYAGQYKVSAKLKDNQGHVLSEAVDFFTIKADSDRTIRTSVNTDKTTYEAAEQVQITGRIRNQSNNQLQGVMDAMILVKDAQGQEIYRYRQKTRALLPGEFQDINDPMTLSNDATGLFQVELIAYVENSDQQIDQSRSEFRVNKPLLSALIGTLTVDHKQVYAGQTIHCSGTVQNTGNTLITATEVKHQLISMADNTPISDYALTDIAPDTTESFSQTIATRDLTPGGYGCVLQANQNGQWQTLAAVAFQVNPALVGQITGSVSLSSGQVEQGQSLTCLQKVTNSNPVDITNLQLIHQVKTQNGEFVQQDQIPIEIAANSDYNQTQSITTQALIPGFYDCAISVDHDGQQKALASSRFEVIKPEPSVVLEPQINTTNVAQGRLLILAEPNPFTLQWLEQILTDQHWQYTITVDSFSFFNAMRSGRYNMYALLPRHVLLSHDQQRELREAVNRGESLLVIGGVRPLGMGTHHTDAIDEALGVYRTFGWPDIYQEVQLSPSPIYQGNDTFTLYGQNIITQIDTAEIAGEYTLISNKQYHKKGGDNTAITYQHYGEGKTVFFAFDLITPAVFGKHPAILPQLFLNALAYLTPDQPLLDNSDFDSISFSIEQSRQCSLRFCHLQLNPSGGIHPRQQNQIEPSGTNTGMVF